MITMTWTAPENERGITTGNGDLEDWWILLLYLLVFFASVPTVVITRLPYSSAMSLCYDNLLSYLPNTMDLLQVANISMGSTGYLWNLWEHLQYLWLSYKKSTESLWYLRIYGIYGFATIYLWIPTWSMTHYDSYGLYKNFQSLLMKKHWQLMNWQEAAWSIGGNQHLFHSRKGTKYG